MSDRVARAVAAAAGCARSLGLPVGEPRVLADGVNVVVSLGPAPVVARVATLTPLLRPDAAHQPLRDLALARALVAAGAPVLAPSDLVPAGPHTRDGLVLSFWRRVDVSDRRPTPAEAGRTLADLHAVLRDVDPGWDGDPLDTPLQDLAAFAGRGVSLGAPADLVERTAVLVEELRPRLAGPVQVLHGDAHPGNLLHSPDGWVWADLEDTCRGPVGWDLACLRRTGRLDGRAALDAVPGAPSDAELAPWLSLRALHAAAWWFVHAVRLPEDLPAAREQLRDAVAEVSAR
ncbi:aminoglycoside phosphotransferase family protein [Modestobacter sp. Leaf380]|uniref:aminoglycoside phosphotransferase family protein n=1 Tax=Modestobacter sp. Leaf380 TaxID=1736356 RepID=UPI0006FE751A|nr:aminoglycoside phosphotransferase family protein [Modestobacter sp. Leaf380]KQS68462.1 aminoglycoside phosphotransferase [Modestobacter sp. Leaf380]